MADALLEEQVQENQNEAAPADAAAAPIVSVRGLGKRFRRESGAVVTAVDDVSLDVHAGEFVVLLGPSGCGKTTLLRMLAGLETPDTGSIAIRGQTVFDTATNTNLPTEHRSISMIFQSYALWPHMTVFQNVAYPLQRRGLKLRRAEIAQQVERVLELVRIPDLARQYPNQMSGGQQQRVALARALVSGSDLVLFDEPLSNVDAQVRERLRYELLEMQRELGFAAVYVTHDQSEAMGLANRIAVMGDGKIQQIASPRETYENPRSRYVANFIGVSNEIPGTLAAVGENRTGVIDTPLGKLHGRVQSPELTVGDDATLVWRPEHAAVTKANPDTPGCFSASVITVVFAGPHMELMLEADGLRFRAWTHVTAEIEPGATVWVAPDADYNRILRS
ncbi:MAG TPA: ABC transporter ATP-binding protein [Natronosporangium sp.]